MEKRLTEYVLTAPGNFVAPETALAPELAGMPIYEAPLLAVGDAADPLFAGLKAPAAVGDWFRLPEEWLPGAKRVISVFLPFSRQIKDADPDGPEPSSAWLHGRIEGQVFLLDVMRKLKALLEADGYRAVVPVLEPGFRFIQKAKAPGDPSFTSSWSERHVAYVCGLGTFGLSKGLITEKGICGRFGSVVTDAPLPVTQRAYTELYEYCTECGACIRRCPSGAITAAGKDHNPCSDHVDLSHILYAPRYGCGKCQVRVPCTDGIPGRKK